MSPFDCPRRIEDAKVRARVVALLKERRAALITAAVTGQLDARGEVDG